MDSIKITKKHINRMKKFLEIYILKKQDIDINYYINEIGETLKEEKVIYNRDIKMYIEIDIDYEDDEPNSFHIDFRVSCFNTCIMSERITDRVGLVYCEREYFCEDEVKYNDIEKVMNKIEELEDKEYKKCKIMYCKNLACKNELCEKDYIYDCKNDKYDCCICKENDGAWVKLTCGHILHKACYSESKIKNCPLCRNTINWRDAIFYYDFIHE